MSSYKLADGRYQARWRDPDGRQRTQIFPTKRESEDHLAEIRVGKTKGTYVGAASGSVKLADFAVERWLPHIRQVRRPNTVTTYAGHLKNHVVPQLGSRKIGTIKKIDCQSFATYLSVKPEPLAPATVGTVVATLQALLKFAVADGLIAVNPCSDLELPEIEDTVTVPLTAAEVAALAAAITPRYEVAVWVAAGCGLREGEALGLIQSRVNFLRRRVQVVEQMQNRKLSPLKSKASRREVPADDMVLAKITAHLQQWPAGGDGLVITNRLGRPVQRNSFGFCWRAAVEAAGLPPGTRFHDLRHFYASALIRAGMNPKVVQVRMGHATIAETMNTYSHLFPDDADLGRGAIEAMFKVEGPGSAETGS